MDTLQVLRLEFQKFRILEILNFHPGLRESKVLLFKIHPHSEAADWLFKCVNEHTISTIIAWDHYNNAGVDPGFLERGFIRIMCVGSLC